uniref:Ig-like domain-containing protein n=1 Tax=Oreochromis niloticus TaxID=8128 RepID=A0A669D7U1_ORENI
MSNRCVEKTITFLYSNSDTLVPVKIVQLGEPANLTCALPDVVNIRGVHWYRQSVGDTLKLIVTLFETATPQYGQEIFKSRFQTHYDKKFSNLTILKAVQDDEGIYHCGIIEWINPEWTGTYLLVKGNNQPASNYTVVQWPTLLNPLRSGNSVTLQCSVYSDSDKMCPRDYNVFWFRAGSDQLHPSIIYTDGNRHSESEIISDSQERCLYRFSKNVSSSDAGTYYCAVATCGEILFGNGTKLDIEVQPTQSAFIQMAILIVCLAISLFGNVVLICNRRVCKPFQDTPNKTSNQAVHDSTKADEELNYAALHFSERKTRRKRKTEFAEDSVYSQVKR